MSIRCYAEGIECGVMGPEEAARTILTETDRLSDMVEDLIYISKLDGRPDLTGAEPHDLRETFSLAASDQRHMAESKGILFEFDFDEEPVMMVYKENDLRQLCSNLISNAIRYAKNMITLTCRNTDKELILRVQDDGDGISEEDLPHLFERFYKGKDGKHGIGLAIVYSVTKLYNGTIIAENNEGACFTITFQKRESDC